MKEKIASVFGNLLGAFIYMLIVLCIIAIPLYILLMIMKTPLWLLFMIVAAILFAPVLGDLVMLAVWIVTALKVTLLSSALLIVLFAVFGVVYIIFILVPFVRGVIRGVDDYNSQAK